MIKQSCFQKMPNYENQKIKAHPTKNTTYGEIPNEWKVSLLKDICVKKIGVQTGPFGSQLHQKDYKKVGTPIITVEHLGENRIIHENLPLVSDEDRDRLNRYILKEGDTVFSRVGSVDRRAFVKNEEEGWLFSGRCLRVRPDPQIVDPSYLSWFFGHPNFKDYIRRIAVGATMPSLNTNLLESVEIILPSMDEQKKIASILDSLSEKIDLNQQMNSTLEQIAQTLFKHWFIDFEFPDENGNPYKSSGGRMVDSELGEIPEGWEVKPIDEVADFLNGLALQKYPPENSEYLPVIKIRELKQGITEVTDKTSTKIDGKYIVSDGDILFSWSGSLECCIWCNGKGALNQHLFKVTSSNYPKWFCYLWINNYLPHYRHIAEGKATTMGHIQRHHLSETFVLVPTSELLEKMDGIISPLFEKIISNNLQARSCSNLRDSLLPKLMSGKIRVEC